jgi:SAM-dependent methyltransferase
MVIGAMYDALTRLGVPTHATVLEPGCGSGNFLRLAPAGMCFIGVELDRLSGRIAKALYPAHDIRIENFRDTRLPADRLDAVIGNVPFADVKLAYGGRRLSLHDFFFAKSLDALKPGGILALLTTHYTLDKHNAGVREYLADRADCLGAIRLPSDAFKREGTSVVTDMVFLWKRAPGEPARHADPEWLQTDPLLLDGVTVPINRYFLRHPEMVLGTWSREDRLYASTYSVLASGDVSEQLQDAVQRLPEHVFTGEANDMPSVMSASCTPPPPLAHITEGSFFIGDDQTIQQWTHGEAVPVTHGATPLKADGTLMGRRLADLITLRDLARRVLHSQNEGWPEGHRQEARRVLNRAYDRFVQAYGLINTTTFGERQDGGVIRRMPNLVTFRDDPDAMLVMSLEEYDEVSGIAIKAAIMEHDVVGRSPAVTSVRSAEEGLLVSLNTRGRVDLPLIARLYHAPEYQIIAELGDLLYQDPDTGEWQTADVYLSGNVRAKLAAAERAGTRYARNVEARSGTRIPVKGGE